MFLSYYHYFQLTAAMTGLIFWASAKKHSMLWLVFLSLAGFLFDSYSRYITVTGHPSNYYVLNTFLVVAAPITFYGFYKHLDLTLTNRKVYKVAAACILLSFYVDYFFITGENELSTIALIFFNFFNIILACGQLFRMALEERAFNLFDEPMFWVSAGLLIFSLGALVTLGMNQFIRINQLMIKNRVLYKVIMPVLNVILYSSYTYAFILCRLKRKSYSPSLS